jgi:ligand-binding SRPBCC domain-containing protein
MPIIVTRLFIQAPAAACFDLARSIDIHMASTAHTQERAVGGRTSGLIKLGESVTWEAVHFGIRQRLTASITAFERPYRFVDEMVSGAFKSFWHEHRFEESSEGTWMTDTFAYTSPLGPLGRLADRLFLRAYMEELLTRRNQYMKQCAESAKGEWSDDHG